MISDIGQHIVRDRSEQRAALCARVFLWIGLPAIMALALLIAPLSTSDEPAHFLRAAAIAQGHVLPQVRIGAVPGAREPRSAGGAVDTAAADYANSVDFDQSRDPDHKMTLRAITDALSQRPTGRDIYAAHSNTAIYPPLMYVTPAAVFAIGKALQAPPVVWLYLARLAGGMVGVALLAWAIRHAGMAAPVLLVMASTPICLYQTAGISADALLLPMAAVFAAMLSRLAAGSVTSRGELALLGVATLLLGAGKVAYLPLVILPPLAAWWVDRRWSGRVVALLVLAVGTAVVWAAWAFVIHDKVFSIRPEVTTDPRQQLQWMIGHPLAMLGRYGDLLVRDGAGLALEMFGYQLGWQEFGMPGWFVLAQMLCAIGIAVVLAGPPRRDWGLALIVLAVALGCGCIIIALIYAQFNEVGAPAIIGVQGRYFTPLAMLVLCMVPGAGARTTGAGRAVVHMGAGMAVCSAMFTVARVAARYWL